MPEQVSLIPPNANMEQVNSWAEKQQEFDYQCYMQLRELLTQLECMGSIIKRYDRENGSELAEQVREARHVVDSREVASDNMLRAMVGQESRDMPEWTEPDDEE